MSSVTSASGGPKSSTLVKGTAVLLPAYYRPPRRFASGTSATRLAVVWRGFEDRIERYRMLSLAIVGIRQTISA